MTIFLSFWVLPILFILHDFEEMICVPLWKKRHSQILDNMSNPFFGKVTNGQAFSVGVLEEMLILIIISIYCNLSNDYNVYLSFVIIYTLHFAMHYRMCFSIKSYVPGVVSASIQLPFLIWLIMSYWSLSQISILKLLLYLIPSFLIAFINLFLMHKIMPIIQNKLLSYSEPS